MPTEIKPKWSSPSALTITLASLASSTSGVGRQSTMVDNSVTRYRRIFLLLAIKLGTSPNSNAPISVYLLRYDTTAIRTDGAGATDAALTIKQAIPIGVLTTGPSAATGDVLIGDFVVDNPGPSWGIAIVNGSGVALDSTGGNHVVNWLGESPEIVVS